jgi:hypothetical protein
MCYIQRISTFRLLEMENLHTRPSIKTKQNIIRHYPNDKPKIVLINKSSHVVNLILNNLNMLISKQITFAKP